MLVVHILEEFLGSLTSETSTQDVLAQVIGIEAFLVILPCPQKRSERDGDLEAEFEYL